MKQRSFRLAVVAVVWVFGWAQAQEDPNPLQLTLVHSAPASYTPGQPIEITVDIGAINAEGVTALGLLDTVPPGWTFAGVRGISGELPAVMPPQGNSGTLEFAWITMPAFPYRFAYTLQVPESAVGSAIISGQVEYRATAGRQLTQPNIITIGGKPNTPPKITLNGSPQMTLAQGANFVDPGATATDKEDGDLSGSITTSGGVDTSAPGEYVISYSVTDSGGETATAERMVTVAGTGTNNGNDGTGNNGGGTGGGVGTPVNRGRVGMVDSPVNRAANANKSNSNYTPPAAAANAAKPGAAGANAPRQGAAAAAGKGPQPIGPVGIGGPGAPSGPKKTLTLASHPTAGAGKAAGDTPAQNDDIAALDSALFGDNSGELKTDAAGAGPGATPPTAVAAKEDAAAEKLKAVTPPVVPGLMERARMRLAALGRREMATILASGIVLLGLIGFAVVAGRLAYAGPTRRHAPKVATE